jgi:hypothetical protein
MSQGLVREWQERTETSVFFLHTNMSKYIERYQFSDLYLFHFYLEFVKFQL